MDDGLAWWNEEFWVTVFINFSSVAVTIALTVWISYRIMHRQIEAERSAQALARAEQVADFNRDLLMERRIRFTDDLAEVLARYAGRIEGAAATIRANPNNNTVRYYQGAISENTWEVGNHTYRRAKSERMHDSLTKIEMQTVRLLSIAEDLTRSLSQDEVREREQEFLERWLACANAIAREIRLITEHLTDWQENDVVPNRERERIDEELTAMQERFPG